MRSKKAKCVSPCVVSDLERDTVADQQADLQVHEVQVRLQLPVGADGAYHFLSQTQQLPLLADIFIPQFQQVGKLAHDRQRGGTGVHYIHKEKQTFKKRKNM